MAVHLEAAPLARELARAVDDERTALDVRATCLPYCLYPLFDCRRLDDAVHYPHVRSLEGELMNTRGLHCFALGMAMVVGNAMADPLQQRPSPASATASPLLAIDQDRTSVVNRSSPSGAMRWSASGCPLPSFATCSRACVPITSWRRALPATWRACATLSPTRSPPAFRWPPACSTPRCWGVPATTLLTPVAPCPLVERAAASGRIRATARRRTTRCPSPPTRSATTLC